MRFKRLLVCIDFSPPSREAFTTATAIATESGAELVLVHVVQLYPYAGDLPVALLVDRERAITDEARAELDTLVSEAHRAGVKAVSAQILTGVPWHQLVQVLADDPTFDLAIVGTHGRTGIKHVLLGSVAEKIVRHAPCPVLVVRARD